MKNMTYCSNVIFKKLKNGKNSLGNKTQILKTPVLGDLERIGIALMSETHW